MTFEEQHPLLWSTRPSHTSDWASCACGGFEAWARTKDELKALHQAHLEFMRQEAAQAVPRRTHAAVRAGNELHDLRWINSEAGYCAGCNWRLDGQPREKIDRAYQSHLANLPTTY